MYRKDSEGWLKHADFIALDLLCLQISFILAYVLSGYGWNPYHIILCYTEICLYFLNWQIYW